MIFIDSNVWCYFFDTSSKEHRKASDFIEKILEKEEITINVFVVIELAHFLVKNLGPVAGKKKIAIFLEFPLVVEDVQYRSVKEAIDFLWQYSHAGIGGRDATILATMKHLGIKRIATHDRAFKHVEWLDVIDPIR